MLCKECDMAIHLLLLPTACSLLLKTSASFFPANSKHRTAHNAEWHRDRWQATRRERSDCWTRHSCYSCLYSLSRLCWGATSATCSRPHDDASMYLGERGNAGVRERLLWLTCEPGLTALRRFTAMTCCLKSLGFRGSKKLNTYA